MVSEDKVEELYEEFVSGGGIYVPTEVERLIEKVPQIRERIAALILSRKNPRVTMRELCSIVIYVEPFREEAFRRLVRFSFRNHKLRGYHYSGYEETRRGFRLAKGGCFRKIAENVEELRTEAWKLFLESGPKNSSLAGIVEDSKNSEMREWAWQVFSRRRNPSYNRDRHNINQVEKNLVGLIVRSKEFRGRAWEELLRRDPSSDDLLSVAVGVESLRDEARKVIIREIKRLNIGFGDYFYRSGTQRIIEECLPGITKEANQVHRPYYKVADELIREGNSS